MTFYEGIITIAIVSMATMLTRFLPFLIFKSGKLQGGYMNYVGRALPPAVFAMLVIYCFKGMSFAAPSGFLPQLIATAVVVILHLAFRRTLLSVAAGTAVYLLLVNLFFV